MGHRSHAGACPPPFYALCAWGLRRKQPPLQDGYMTPPFAPTLYHANTPLFAYETPHETPLLRPAPRLHERVHAGVAAALLPAQPPPFVGVWELKVPSLPPFSHPLSHANALLFAHETPPFHPASCLGFTLESRPPLYALHPPFRHEQGLPCPVQGHRKVCSPSFAPPPLISQQPGSDNNDNDNTPTTTVTQRQRPHNDNPWAMQRCCHTMQHEDNSRAMP
jgi:hypothetical protein